MNNIIGMKCIHNICFFIIFSITFSLEAKTEEPLQNETCNTMSCTASIEETNQENLEIIILVHGILSIKQCLNPQNMVKFARDKIGDTAYARTIELTRRDSFFYQHHPMQGLGLRKIDLSQEEKGAAAAAYAKALDAIYDQINNTTKRIYYTFGWSGLLSPRMRYLEAKIFYEHMLKEFDQYYQKNINLTIRIIGYSHGGNVALKLAEVYKTEGYAKDNKIIVDELILVGIPILPETDYLVNSSLFKKIYHFYSYGDRVQRLDCFSLSSMFSNRIFHERNDFKLPDKWVQVNIRLKRPAKGKERILQQENPDIAVHRKRLMRTADPGHTELWSFGWTPTSFRNNFPLYPLPFSTFTPFIIHSLEQYAHETKSLSVELHPFLERMLFYDYLAKKETIVPFVTKSQLVLLRDLLKPYIPNNFTKKAYNKRIDSAKKTARRQWLSEHNIRRFGHHKSASFTTTTSTKQLPQA